MYDSTAARRAQPAGPEDHESFLSLLECLPSFFAQSGTIGTSFFFIGLIWGTS